MAGTVQLRSQQQQQHPQHRQLSTAGVGSYGGRGSTNMSIAGLIDTSAQQQVAALGALVAVLRQLQVRCWKP